MSHSYILGSFNLRDFNYANPSTDGENEHLNRDFDRIAKIILDEKFDVIALQEINAESALRYLTGRLNLAKNPMRAYAYAFGADIPHTPGRKNTEYYGFIWNTQRLALVQHGENPGYYRGWAAKNLIRPPYFARFTARGRLGGANFELRIVNTHLLYGDNSTANLANRVAEFDTLVKDVLPFICDLQALPDDGAHMPAYTFLMGDYNLELQRPEAMVYCVQRETTTATCKRDTRTYLTVQTEKTSLRRAGDQQTLADCYASNYDHFTYEDTLGRKLTMTPQRVEALTAYYPECAAPADKLARYRAGISDHVPIKLTVTFCAPREVNHV